MEGVLIKGGMHLENLGGAEVMAFDKTGTLTQGKFVVTDVIPLDGTGEEALLRIAAAAEQQSNHPLALAVTQEAEGRASWTCRVEYDMENISGRGIRGTVDGSRHWPAPSASCR